MIGSMDQDYDVPDAKWIEFTVIGSPYEQEIDVSRVNGRMRHRLRVRGDEPKGTWIMGPAPERNVA